MATEEQTVLDGHFSTVYGGVGAGQRLTISNRVVSKLSFPLQKIGSPGSGNVTFYIVKVSNDSTIVSKVWGNATTLPSSVTWLEVTFDSPVLINEEVRLLVRNHGSGSAGNGLGIHAHWTSDTKADEYFFARAANGDYTDYSTEGYDDGYIYTYTGGGASGTATVTTQACTNTTAYSSTGHGLYSARGDSSVTQHGHCWSTSANPTTALSTKTTNGAAPNLGQFQSAITGLTPGTTYYVVAYATNTQGTHYGSDVTITTGSTIGRRHLWTEGTDLHYFDEYGTERKIEGLAVTSGFPWWHFFR